VELAYKNAFSDEEKWKNFVLGNDMRSQQTAGWESLSISLLWKVKFNSM
jgi:hypothetical protein